MSQYFVESKTKQPIFFCFNRIIQNQESGVDYELIIKEFQDHFDKEQQEFWDKFWNKQGEYLILETWNTKYKDYLREEQEVETLETTNANNHDDNKPKNGNVKTSEITDVDRKKTTRNYSFVEESWDDLWREHREVIYVEQYLIFSTIFYNYFLDFKKSCEIPQVITEELEEVEDKSEPTDLQAESLKLTEELEQLELLGLPTSFGGRPQCSSKSRKTDKKLFIHYSDFFSDSEMENENSSDDERDDKSLDISNIEQEDDNENVLRNIHEKTISKEKKKKRNRKLKNVPAFMQEEKGLLKYWRKRFSLFSRYDEGIRLDRESWFSVTPEKVAKHLAERLKCSIVVDGFCGSGGNAIQFALTCEKVIAIDIDPVKLEMAKHNAKIYKVEHKIEFILGDFLQLASGGQLKADVVFLSPPWGGPKYKNKKEFDIEKYLLPVKASELIAVSRNVSQNVALFLPRNSNVKQIVKLAGVGKRCEIEHNYLDSRLVAITALYGEDILEKKTAN